MNKLPVFYRAPRSEMNFGKRMSEDHFDKISLFIYFFLLVGLFFILFFRLFQLTIVKGEYYRRLADENRIRQIIIEPKRGQIIDRRGQVVAENDSPDLEKIDARLSSQRNYQSPEAIAPIIGYRQLATQEDIKNYPCLNKPLLNDKIGKRGVEKVFECDLRGTSGRKLVELDARGKYIKTLTVAPAQDGKTIKLTLDLELQKKASELMKDKKGAIVGIQTQTGGVMTLFSSPTFSPQDFENNNQGALSDYLNDKNRPLFNRATEGLYPPGSIFKIVIATAALQDKKIDDKTIFVDSGEIQAGPLKFGNWYFLQYGKTEGPVDIVKGIRRSVDTFFYEVGDRVGPERIKYWSEKFGFGHKTALPFDQAEGLIPSPFWKEEKIRDRWYQGDNYNLAIGQGYLSVTPLQIAQATSVFASGGRLCQPKLLKDEKSDCQSLNLSTKTLELVREGMRQACSAGGTGWPFFDFQVGGKKINVGCKTGTAENNSSSGLPHAWFTVFAPYENPEIVLTVLVEESGQGSDIAAPIAKEILKTYFERKE